MEQFIKDKLCPQCEGVAEIRLSRESPSVRSRMYRIRVTSHAPHVRTM